MTQFEKDALEFVRNALSYMIRRPYERGEVRFREGCIEARVSSGLPDGRVLKMYQCFGAPGVSVGGVYRDLPYFRGRAESDLRSLLGCHRASCAESLPPRGDYDV